MLLKIFKSASCHHWEVGITLESHHGVFANSTLRKPLYGLENETLSRVGASQYAFTEAWFIPTVLSRNSSLARTLSPAFHSICTPHTYTHPARQQAKWTRIGKCFHIRAWSLVTIIYMFTVIYSYCLRTLGEVEQKRFFTPTKTGF